MSWIEIFAFADADVSGVSTFFNIYRKENNLLQGKVGIVGSGGIGLAYAAWTAHTGYDVSIWSPRGSADALRSQPLNACGILDVSLSVTCVGSAQELVTAADVILIAVPVNGHKRVMDELLPYLRSGQTVIVSSMGSLSSLYLFESALSRGVDLQVASFATTVLTARRKHSTQVDIMAKRPIVPVSCVPLDHLSNAMDICRMLFGDVFTPEENLLVTALANSNPIAHVPLALLNWTRIERKESWPQYYYMTPHVAKVIEKLDAERLAVAKAFGISVISFTEHLSRSFNVSKTSLADGAAELHERRGGPPGPTNVDTRYLSEDVPFGLVFLRELGGIAQVPVPVMDALIAMSDLIFGKDFAADNDMIQKLEMSSESVNGLLARARYTRIGQKSTA